MYDICLFDQTALGCKNQRRMDMKYRFNSIGLNPHPHPSYD
jgi:hypothetical protein